jgi:hypothetical protein
VDIEKMYEYRLWKKNGNHSDITVFVFSDFRFRDTVSYSRKSKSLMISWQCGFWMLVEALEGQNLE